MRHEAIAEQARTINQAVHIDDVVTQLAECSSVFGELNAIFAAITEFLEQQGDPLGNVAGLARAGRRIATDLENVADCWREDVSSRGVRAI